MLQKQFIDILRRSAIVTKEHACRKRPSDISPFVVAHRGDDPIALVAVRQHAREPILETAALMAEGFDADQIGLVFESYQAQVDPDDPVGTINPMTGRMWKSGELRDAVENHDGIAKGWATECVSLTAINRATDAAVMHLPFRYSGKHLVWLAEQDWTLTESGQTRGRIIDALVEIMNAPSATHLMQDWPPDRDGRDLAMGQHLTNLGHAVLMYSRGDDTARRARFTS